MDVSKVIVTIDGNIPTKYAHSFNVMNMAQGFRDNSLVVEVVTALTFPLILNRIKLGEPHKFYDVDKQIDIKTIAIPGLDFFTKTIGVSGYVAKAVDYIANQNPDLLFARSFAVAAGTTEKGIPTILETHASSIINPDLIRVHKLSDRENFLGIVTIHDDLRQLHIDAGVPAEKVITLEDGVDDKYLQLQYDRDTVRGELGVPRDRGLVVYAGGLYPEKGIEHILLTAEKLPDQLFILVGGRGEQIQQWKDYCNRKEISNVQFAGFVDQGKVFKYLQAADVLMMPYKLDQDYEVMDIGSTSPLKLFEYMASGTPIVSSDIPVITKIVRDGEHALLAKPGDIDVLAENVSKLINDKALSAKLAQAAKQEVAQYTWKARCAQILDKLVR